VAVALMASLLEKAGKKVAVVCIQPGRIEFRGQVTAKVKDSIDVVIKALQTVMSARN
jgi:Ni,Fe-hydrogenase maturation factor